MDTRDHDELADRLLDFAARVGKAVDALPESRLGRHIAGQLVRSGTSPAPNYAEACGAESRKDFIHKLSICLKELRESRCWIQLIIKAELLSQSQMANLQDECNQLCNIIGKSIVTAKNDPKAKTKYPTKMTNPLCTLHFSLCSLDWQ
jgi:four helix bundle protein